MALINEYNNLIAKANQIQQRIAETDQQISTLQNQQLAAQKQVELETKVRNENASTESNYRTLVERQSTLANELTNYRDALAAAETAFTKDAGSSNAGVLSSLLNDASSRLESCTSMLANQQHNLATLQKEAEAIKERLETANSMIEKSRVELETLRAEREADAGANSKLQEQLATLSPELDTAQATWLEQSEQRFLVADLRPLTPEQLAWSIMTVTGTVENTKAAVRVEMDKERTPPNLNNVAERSRRKWLRNFSQRSTSSFHSSVTDPVNLKMAFSQRLINRFSLPMPERFKAGSGKAGTAFSNYFENCNQPTRSRRSSTCQFTVAHRPKTK